MVIVPKGTINNLFFYSKSSQITIRNRIFMILGTNRTLSNL